MDTRTLVEKIKELKAAFMKEGKEIIYSSYVRAYPEYDSSSFIIALTCPWMKHYESIYEKTEEVVDKMYSLFDSETLKSIHSVVIFDTVRENRLFVYEKNKEYKGPLGVLFTEANYNTI